MRSTPSLAGVTRRESKRVAVARAALDGFEAERDPLARLDKLRRAIDALQQLERLTLDVARDRGCTWTEIGALYGLTKQGAQQRFRRGHVVTTTSAVAKRRTGG